MTQGSEKIATSATSKMSDLKLRFLSALVLGPVVIALVYFGGFAYSAMILVAALLFQYEWFSITGSKALDVLTGIGYLSLVLSVVGYISGYPLIAVGVIVAGAALLYLVSGFSIRGRWGAEGLVYSGLALLSLVAARAGQDGLAFVVFLLVVVWATDIFAYFVGRFVGGPKLWRRVSPNKTWSGALGGLAFSIALGSLCAFLFGYTDLTGWALLAIALSLVSQAGDLLESAIKRRFDVKDSSRLIPGHGGIMDRIDGLVSAAILASALGLAFGGTLADPISGLGLS